MIFLAEVVALVLGMYILFKYMAWEMGRHIEQKYCPHDQGVHETRACDAICKLCGKNLGFIGTEENKVRRSQ
jgi:hypothetical protein